MSRYINFTKLKHLIFPNGESRYKHVTLGRPRRHIVYPRAYDWPSKDVRGTIEKKMNKCAHDRGAKATESEK
jgi:hypothetical protein